MQRLWIKGLVVPCLAVAVALLVLHLAVPPVYRFPPPAPFHGRHWYNPYADTAGEWLKANFHAHGRSWFGLPRGDFPTEAMYGQYRRLGYDVIGISNYQSIRARMPGEMLYITAYEHGFNAGQRHQTVLGATSVSWLDFPLFQGMRHKQYIIDHLREGADVVVLNHPNKIGSYSLDDMASLTGYDGIEIATKYARGLRHWDAALSAGRPVWGFCGDDRDNLNRLRHSGTAWLMVRAAGRTKADVISALREGRFYGLWARRDAVPPVLRSCTVTKGCLRVVLTEPVEVVRIIGQNGIVRSEVRGVNTATYRMAPDDTYLRAEVASTASTLFLNPILRGDGSLPSAPAARITFLPTLAVRGLGAIIALAALALLIRFARRRRGSER